MTNFVVTSLHDYTVLVDDISWWSNSVVSAGLCSRYDSTLFSGVTGNGAESSETLGEPLGTVKLFESLSTGESAEVVCVCTKSPCAVPGYVVVD